MGKGLYVSLIIFAVLIFVLAFASMVLSTMTVQNINKSNIDDAQNYSKYNAIINGCVVGAVIILFILLIIYHKETIVTAAKSAQAYATKKVGQAGAYMQGMGAPVATIPM